MREIIQMKYESASDQPNSSNKKLLSWDELLEKGTLLKDTILRLSLTPDRPYLVTKSCTDGTFQTGDLIFLEPGRDLFCPKTGLRISPVQCTRDNLDFICIPADVDS